MKKGLVLEGGALRGLFSAGVIDVMMEQGLEPDGLVGVSAGAAFGCNYKSRQPGRCIRYNKQFAHDKRYCSLTSFLKTGDLFGGEFCYHTLPTQLDLFDTHTFDTNPMDFYAVCTDVETGQAEYRKLQEHGYECYEWIRASASMPLVSRIVSLNGRKMLDGGLADSIPLQFFQSKGYDRNIVVLTQPKGYIKTPNKLMPLIKWKYRRYPKFVEACANRHLMYNQELEYVASEEQSGHALVIRPTAKLSIEHISHNPDEMQQVYEHGREIALSHLNEIKNFWRQ
ncbi:patatin family protein [Prevotella sp. S7 MS 2]|uniref:patatin-like phospholipase family protein n=1 Tax=Prevotella sp. S7 MS 2 TaxID=1287488 RepID=UPI0005138CED|nr:patatin family protein [Prevotella sp. S7 MS 2]KGI60613.1 serine protease [Prevotella sp. S7 MS 2]